jgi:hypothetical protein
VSTDPEEAVLVKLDCILIVRVVVTLASDEMLELGLNGRGFELVLIWLKLLFLDKFDLVSDKSDSDELVRLNLFILVSDVNFEKLDSGSEGMELFDEYLLVFDLYPVFVSDELVSL